MPDQKTDAENLQKQADNTDLDAGGTGDGMVEEHEIVMIGEESSSSDKTKDAITSTFQNQHTSNADAARRRIDERRRKDSANQNDQQLTDLKNQVSQLMSLVATQSKPPVQTSTPPTLESVGYDTTAHDAALAQWARDAAKPAQPTGNNVVETIQTAVRDEFALRNNEQTADQKEQSINAQITAHYDRASKLKVKDYAGVEKKAFDILGDQLAMSIAALVDNSELVLFQLGRKPELAENLANLAKVDSGRATLEIGRISGGLQKVVKRTKAPEPEDRLNGTENNSVEANYADTPEGRQSARRAKAFANTTFAER